MFERYEDPLKGLKVWQEYVPDLSQKELILSALRVVKECRTSDELDTRLYLLSQTPHLLDSHPSNFGIRVV